MQTKYDSLINDNFSMFGLEMIIDEYFKMHYNESDEDINSKIIAFMHSVEEFIEYSYLLTKYTRGFDTLVDLVDIDKFEYVISELRYHYKYNLNENVSDLLKFITYAYTMYKQIYPYTIRGARVEAIKLDDLYDFLKRDYVNEHKIHLEYTEANLI